MAALTIFKKVINKTFVSLCGAMHLVILTFLFFILRFPATRATLNNFGGKSLTYPLLTVYVAVVFTRGRATWKFVEILGP